MQSPGFITKDPMSWENPPSLVRGTVGLYQASEWEYSWDSEAGTRSPWQPSEEGQLVRLRRVCLTAPVGTRRSAAAWEPGLHGMSSRLQQGGEAGARTDVTNASVLL